MAHLFICTGENSGDLQGSHLIQALKRHRPDLQITAVGGDRMAAAGAQLLHHTSAISSIGLIEAIPFIGPALLLEWRIRRHLHRYPPDLCILVDYIGVNSRISQVLHRQGIPAIYYIAPQEWVWSQNNKLSYQLAERMRLMLAIFVEEARFYEKRGANVRWVGHPLIDILRSAPTRDQARQHLGISPEQIAVMVFPASRTQEIRQIVPVLFQAAQQLQQQLPPIQIWLSLASPRFRAPILRQARRYGLDLKLIEQPGTDHHQTLLAAADLVLAKSGTVNLEAAILGIPQVIVYRLSPITHWIAKHLLKVSVPFISPANLAMMRPIVTELFQDQAQPEAIVKESIALLTDADRRQRLHQDYAQMRIALGAPGVLDRAAAEILRVLDQQTAKDSQRS